MDGRLAAALTGFLLACAAHAQAPDAPNGVLLVAKPGMPDPRFRETVVLVTQAPDASTVGVVLNRALRVPLAELMPDAQARDYRGTLYYGGPVMERAIVALFRSDTPPAPPAFQVLPGIYLSMHPDAVEPLLLGTAAPHRLFAGFSGWAPGQLQGELKRDDWLVVPATAELLFRTDTARMWRELIEKSRGVRTRAGPEARAILAP